MTLQSISSDKAITLLEQCRNLDKVNDHNRLLTDMIDLIVSLADEIRDVSGLDFRSHKVKPDLKDHCKQFVDFITLVGTISGQKISLRNFEKSFDKCIGQTRAVRALAVGPLCEVIITLMNCMRS